MTDAADQQSGTAAAAWLALAGFLLLVMLALMVPVDHDEGQYVAATHFVAQGLRPYRDFSYLQTPLQPFVLAPLAWLAPGWLLIASRLANAAAMALAALLVARTAAKLSGRTGIGIAALIAVLTVDAVQFGGSVARNDALPMLLFAFGLERLFAGTKISRSRALMAGLAIALAASTKASYALPAAAVAGQILWHSRGRLSGEGMALLVGLALGALPVVLFLLTDREVFLFGAYRYSLDGVRAWQELRGSIEMLSGSHRLLRLLGFLALGPALPLMAVAGWLAVRSGQGGEPKPLGVGLGLILIAAVVAAVLPMPAYRQYVIPLVAPLILWIAAKGGALFDWLGAERKRRAVALGIALLCVVAGSARSARELLATPPLQRPLAVEGEAHAIGRVVGAAGARTIAGLDPVRLVDSGLAFDPRFAAGPFLFRAGNLAACRSDRLCPMTYAKVGRLADAPPDALLTGTERRLPAAFEGGLDGIIDHFAAAHGYRAIALGDLRLWIGFTGRRSGGDPALRRGNE